MQDRGEKVERNTANQKEGGQVGCLLTYLSKKYGKDIVSMNDQEIFVNHVKEVLQRKKDNSLIKEIDPSLFKEVSKEAWQESSNFLKKYAIESNDEIFLLAVHFQNILNKVKGEN